MYIVIIYFEAGINYTISWRACHESNKYKRLNDYFEKEKGFRTKICHFFYKKSMFEFSQSFFHRYGFIISWLTFLWLKKINFKAIEIILEINLIVILSRQSIYCINFPVYCQYQLFGVYVLLVHIAYKIYRVFQKKLLNVLRGLGLTCFPI